MKIQKSNNPLAVGALLCVLAVIVGRTVWLVTRGDGTAQMVSAVATVPATAGVAEPHAATAAATSSVLPATKPTPPRSARNPFVTRTPRRTASATPAAGAAEPPATVPPKEHATGKADASQVRPLPPLPIAPLPLSRTGQQPAGPTPQTAALSAPVPESDPLQNVRLTAIVDGAKRMAVLQTTDPQPVVVHEGDTVQGLRVAAIRGADVVFTRGDRSWTLPLQTAETSLTVTPTDAAPTAQENVDAPH